MMDIITGKEGLGGLPRVGDYMSENTFYIVFLDSMHRFWISENYCLNLALLAPPQIQPHSESPY